MPWSCVCALPKPSIATCLKVQAEKKACFSGKDILQKLAAHDHDLADTFPQLSIVAKIILVCPLGTASVERSFSAMGRVCNRLRQQILPENLAHCLRASIEGPNILTTEQAELITKKWHSFNESRRIRIWTIIIVLLKSWSYYCNENFIFLSECIPWSWKVLLLLAL